jgi:phosphoribosylamine--glycine ligase
MNVLLIGSGGREHALAWKISQSSLLENLYIAPGNGGTQLCGQNVSLNPIDFKEVKKFVLEKHVDLVVVGPEAPLVAGIADFFRAEPTLAHVGVVGPDKCCAQLEGSKDFAKQFMKRHRIPTARYETFTLETLELGKAFLENLDAPYVLKADGLAAGKGVLIIADLKEAKSALEEMLGGQFGEASAKVVIEEFLSGIEMSYFVVTDGSAYKVLPSAKDYKRIGVGDTGPNTAVWVR